MRYDLARIYQVANNLSVRYYLVKPEVKGSTLCTKPDGTGVNAKGRLPRVRYYYAADGRGNCSGQILVTDAVEAPSRKLDRGSK